MAVGRQIFFINAAHCFTHYALLILPTAVLAMTRPGSGFAVGCGTILTLSTGMFVCYGAGSLPQGWLSARFGARTMLAAFFVGTGLSLIAAGQSSGPGSLAIALSCAGVFASIYHPIGTAMLIDAAGDRPGRAIGLNGVFGNLGVALAPIATAYIAQLFGWRLAFVLPGSVFVLMGAAFWRDARRHPRNAAAAPPFPEIPPALVRRAVIVLLLIAVVSGLVFNAFTLLLPKLMQERLASSPELLPVVGLLAFAVTLCGAVSQLTLGRLIDRARLKRIFLPLALLLGPALLGLAFASGWPALILAAVIAALIFGQLTVNETMAARYIAPTMRAHVYSVRFFVGFLGSAAAAPLVGVVFETTSSSGAVLLVLAALAVVTLGCAVWFPDRREELDPQAWRTAVLSPAE